MSPTQALTLQRDKVVRAVPHEVGSTFSYLLNGPVLIFFQTEHQATARNSVANGMMAVFPRLSCWTKLGLNSDFAKVQELFRSYGLRGIAHGFASLEQSLEEE